MKTMFLLLVSLSFVSPYSPAMASDTKPFDGTYALTSKDFIDPPPNEKIDRVNLYFSGQTAKDVYDAMPGPAMKDECNSDETVLIKTAGGLECLHYPDGYHCGIGVMLKSGKTASAMAC